MRRTRHALPLFLAGLTLGIANCAIAEGKPTVVRVVKAGAGYELRRDGKAYFIKGGGGDGSLEALAEAGRELGADLGGREGRQGAG